MSISRRLFLKSSAAAFAFAGAGAAIAEAAIEPLQEEFNVDPGFVNVGYADYNVATMLLSKGLGLYGPSPMRTKLVNLIRQCENKMVRLIIPINRMRPSNAPIDVQMSLYYGVPEYILFMVDEALLVDATTADPLQLIKYRNDGGRHLSHPRYAANRRMLDLQPYIDIETPIRYDYEVICDEEVIATLKTLEDKGLPIPKAAWKKTSWPS